MALKNHVASPVILLVIAVALSGCVDVNPFSPMATVAPTIMPTPVSSATVQSPTAPPINSLPTGTDIMWALGSGPGQLIVNNTITGQDAVVILAGADDPGTALAAVYVKGGDQYTIYGIGDGQYVLYDMIGTNWNGTAKSFTHTNEYAKVNRTLKYYSTQTESKVYIVTLSPVGNGDARSQPVSAGDMPAL